MSYERDGYEVTIPAIQGSGDGIRFGLAWKGKHYFNWTYDLINDAVGLYHARTDQGGYTPFTDEGLASGVRDLVRSRLSGTQRGAG